MSLKKKPIKEEDNQLLDLEMVAFEETMKKWLVDSKKVMMKELNDEEKVDYIL